jgi:hypothetical protein
MFGRIQASIKGYMVAQSSPDRLMHDIVVREVPTEVPDGRKIVVGPT